QKIPVPVRIIINLAEVRHRALDLLIKSMACLAREPPPKVVVLLFECLQLRCDRMCRRPLSKVDQIRAVILDIILCKVIGHRFPPYRTPVRPPLADKVRPGTGACPPPLADFAPGALPLTACAVPPGFCGLAA